MKKTPVFLCFTLTPPITSAVKETDAEINEKINASLTTSSLVMMSR